MKKKWLSLAIVLTLIAGTCMAASISSEAVSLDLDRECSMTIYPENPNTGRFGADLEMAKVQVDIYKVADAVKISGSDSYTYNFIGDYAKLKETESVLSGEVKAGGWQSLAQAAAKAVLGYKDVLGNGEDIPPTISDSHMVMQNVSIYSAEDNDIGGLRKKVGGMDAGLYLIIARGEGMNAPEDYRVTMQSMKHQSGMSGGIATIANSDNYTYLFAPQLISVPMKSDVVSGTDSASENGPLPEWNDNYTTSGSGEWIYDVSVYLKPVRVSRYGSLEISKRLQAYESEEVVQDGQQAEGSNGQDEKTTFVFKTTWANPDYTPDSGLPEKISRVDSVTFPIINENGEKVYDWQLYVDGIPLGTEVTVEEVYSGASYEIVGGEEAKSQKVTLEKGIGKIKNGIAILDNSDAVVRIVNPEDESGDEKRTEVSASVAFTNTYNGNQRKGYGINNEFEYDGQEGKYDGWTWTNGTAGQGNQEGQENQEGTPAED